MRSVYQRGVRRGNGEPGETDHVREAAKMMCENWKDLETPDHFRRITKMVCTHSVKTGNGMVGAAGFEPATSRAQGERASGLRYAPTIGGSMDGLKRRADFHGLRRPALFTLFGSHHRPVADQRAASADLGDGPVSFCGASSEWEASGRYRAPALRIPVQFSSIPGCGLYVRLWCQHFHAVPTPPVVRCQPSPFLQALPLVNPIEARLDAAREILARPS